MDMEPESLNSVPFRWNKISCSLKNSMAISNDGDVNVWGKQDSGILNLLSEITSFKVLIFLL